MANPKTGFTLVEVMVALAVVAVALPALMVSLAQQVDGTGYLRDKSLAHMVATNKLVELRIQVAAQQRQLGDRDSGMTEMAGREWYWWVQSSPTRGENAFRLEIKVADSEANADLPLYRLVTFYIDEQGE